jgi:hypothetical protein
MKLSAAILGTLAIVGGGCEARVVDGAPSGPGTATEALAMYVRDLPSSADAYPVLPVNQAVDPDALLVFFASEAQSCGEPVIPLPFDGSCEQSMWQLAVIVPADLDKPGTVELSAPPTLTYQGAVDVSGGDCSVFGAGASPGWPGTMEIVSLDSTSLSVKLSNGVQVGGPHATTIDGQYTVHRCDAAATGP